MLMLLCLLIRNSISVHTVDEIGILLELNFGTRN